MKLLILIPKERVMALLPFAAMPEGFELYFADYYAGKDEIIETCPQAQMIYADSVAPICEALMEGLPQLKLIHVEGAGFNAVDVPAASARGIAVCNCAGLNASAVAEHTVLLMLALLRRLVEGDALVRAGKQIEAKGAFVQAGLHELRGRTVGLVGLGAIAQATAKLLLAFGADVCYYARKPVSDASIRYLPLEELLRESDFVSLHLPSNEQTRRMVNSGFLAQMKPGSYLINTARGDLVDQEALAAAIEEGRLAGGAFDTLDPEPVRPDNPLLNLSEGCRHKLLFSPHIGGITKEAIRAMHRFAWQNLQDTAAGLPPKNRVNPL